MNRMLPCFVPLLVLVAYAGNGADGAHDRADTVSPPQESVEAPAKEGPAKDVTDAAARVRKALQEELGLSAPAVIVSIHASAILLTGKVKSDAEAAHIISIAETAAAGTRVTGDLEVEPEPEAAAEAAAVDAAVQSAPLAHHVQDALRANRATERLSIAVDVNAPKVIGLSGRVPSQVHRVEAERVALTVPGVQRVENRLVVPGE